MFECPHSGYYNDNSKLDKIVEIYMYQGSCVHITKCYSNEWTFECYNIHPIPHKDCYIVLLYVYNIVEYTV